MAISTAVDLSAVARVVGIKTEYKNLSPGNIFYLPQRVVVMGQGSTASNPSYSTDKVQVTSSAQAGETFGFGSPIHLAVRQLLPVNGDGVGTIPVTVYPLKDDGSGVASTGDITPTGAQTINAQYSVKVGNIESEQFVIAVGDTIADVTAKMTTAINAVLEMPVTASDGSTVVNLTSKWAGVSANDLGVVVVGRVDAGTTFAVSDMTGGLVNPEIEDALAQIGNVWESMIINCLNLSDTSKLDTFQTFGEGRWGALTKKPLMVFTGNTEADLNTAITIPDARRDDYTNSVINLPGSPELPFVVASRAVSRIASRANNNPAYGYGSMPLTGLEPGPDSQQWNYLQRDTAVKAGASTIEVKDGVAYISDTVTFYHPQGNPLPEYRYVVSIVKIQQVLFNLDLEFNSVKWDGSPLIPDNQPTSNPQAKKPKMVVSTLAAITDSLASSAIISEPEYTKTNTKAQISEQNPNRIDSVYPIKISGNANIFSFDLDWGFYFGTQAVIA